MVQYEKFFQDYEKIEKLGLNAGVDPIKQRQTEQSVLQNKGELPPEVKKIYNDMSNYVQKMQIIDKLCDSLASKDAGKVGMLPDTVIHEVFKSLKITINRKQLNHLTFPLPFDSSGNYNYVFMIEMLFGKVQATTLQQRHKITVSPARLAGFQEHQAEGPQAKLEMSIRLKDLIELRFQSLQSIAHQVSKGSNLLKEQEFYGVFKRAQLTLLSADIDLF